MTTNENGKGRPLAEAAPAPVPKMRNENSIPSVPNTADESPYVSGPLSSVLAEVDGDLSRIHPRAFAVFCDGHVAGYSEGYSAGYQARAEDEVAEWQPIRDHLAAYAKSLHGLAQRRQESRPRDARTGQDLVRAARASWGLVPEGGGQHVA